MPVTQCPPSAGTASSRLSPDLVVFPWAEVGESDPCPPSLPRPVPPHHLGPPTAFTGSPHSLCSPFTGSPGESSILIHSCSPQHSFHRVGKPQSPGLFSLGPSHPSSALSFISGAAGDSITWSTGAGLGGRGRHASLCLSEPASTLKLHLCLDLTRGPK